VRFWIVAMLLLGAYISLAVLPRFRAAPRVQPMRFSHAAHIKEAECGACHLYATEYYPGGVPSLEDCMDCHQGTQSKSPENKKEESKLQSFADANREIPWQRLPPLAPHVFFSHRRHTVSSKIKCAACHGDIAKTNTIPPKPAIRFTMAWCLACHEARKASTDCLACHR